MRRVFDRGRYRRGDMILAIALTATVTSIYWLVWLYVYNLANEQARFALHRVIEVEAERFERCESQLQGYLVESRILRDEIIRLDLQAMKAGECRL